MRPPSKRGRLRWPWRGYNDLVADVRDARGILWLLRFNVFITTLICVLMLVPEQFAEALQVLVEDAGDKPAPLAVLIAAVLLLAAANWYWARLLIYVLRPESLRWRRLRGLASKETPRLCGVLPVIAFALAFGLAPGQQHAASGQLLKWGAGNLGLAVLFYLAVRFRTRIFGRPKGVCTARGVQPIRAFPLHAHIFAGASVLAWTSLMVLFWAGDGVERAAGALGVVVLGIAAWVGPGCFLVHWSAYLRVPLLSLVVIGAVVFSLRDCNDNHAVRSLAATAAPGPAREGIGATFEAWLAAREGGRTPADGPLPVIIVASQGGGLRQAYYTAVLLGHLEDQIPGFSRNVFAISGVSGGSVGAAVFAAQIRHGQPSAGSYALDADKILGEDLLAPLLSMGLYPDLLQRFLPWPIPAADRARGWERAIERSFLKTTTSDQMSAAFSALWPGEHGHTVPYLFLNTTEVETGERVVIVPILPAAGELTGVGVLLRDAPSLNPALSTAAGLSARFPVVTPVGTYLHEPSGQKRRLADGGYFENSATATVADILAALPQHRRADGSERYRVYVLECRFEEHADPDDGKRSKATAQGLGEVMSPLRALLNTRTARGETARRALNRLLHDIQPVSDASRGGAHPHYIQFEVREGPAALPLGWLLSRHSRDEIGWQLGSPHAKPPGSDRPVHQGGETARTENQERLKRLKNLLDR